jgi:hypothetical protein
MKYGLILATALLLQTNLYAEKSFPLEDWGRMTVPDTYQTGVEFPVKVEILKLNEPTRLVMTANWKKTTGQFGGFLQTLGVERDVTQPESYTFNVTIKKTNPGLGCAVLTVYLSPDGSWKSKTKSGFAEVPIAKKADTAMSDLGTLSEQTQKAKPFSLKTAPVLPSLKEAGFEEKPSFSDEFNPAWPRQKEFWQVATWKQNGTQMSKERCRVNADGHLVQTVTAGSPFQGGSLQTVHEYRWGRWIARVKPSAAPGVLNSIFTKDWDDLTTAANDGDGKKGEIDIELLSHTFGPGKGEVHVAIHLKNHAPLWHLDIPLDFNPSDDFHEWGFDVYPDRTVWHVDGRILHEWKYTKEFYIDPDYEFFFNSWTMEKWIKGPPRQDAQYLIDWVRFYPLTGSPQ